MYAAFAMVLYSRLHLVTTNQKLLRAVLYTIIATGVIFNIPNLLFLCIPVLYQSLIMFQVTYSLNIVFALQEIILSSMYIYLFFKFVRAGRVEGSRFSPRDKTTFKLLILAQLVVLISDVAMVVLIYIRYNLLRMTMVQFTYALKLRLEFVVLNRLAGPEKSRRQTVADNYDLTSESQSSEGRREASWRSWVRILWPKRLCIPEMPVCNTDASMECGEKHAESTTTMMIRHHVSMPASPSGQSSDLGRKASNPEENCARHGSNDNPDSLCIDAMERRYLGQFEVEGMV
jgi:hypothetical protein